MNTLSQDTIDNLLVGQKNYIINLVDQRKFKEAEQCLHVLERMWAAYGYSYKTTEIFERIKISVKEPAPTQWYKAEMTDTFGGEANYSWVQRVEVKATNEANAIRKIRKAFDLVNIRCKKEDYGDQIVLRPSGMCLIVFIDSIESPSTEKV